MHVMRIHKIYIRPICNVEIAKLLNLYSYIQILPNGTIRLSSSSLWRICMLTQRHAGLVVVIVSMCVGKGVLQWDNFLQISNRANVLLEMCNFVVIFHQHFFSCPSHLTSYGTKACVSVLFGLSWFKTKKEIEINWQLIQCFCVDLLSVAPGCPKEG